MTYTWEPSQLSVSSNQQNWSATSSSSRHAANLYKQCSKLGIGSIQVLLVDASLEVWSYCQADYQLGSLHWTYIDGRQRGNHFLSSSCWSSYSCIVYHWVYTSCSPNNALPFSAKDRVPEQRYAASHAIWQNFLTDEHLVQASNNYERILEVPVSTMIYYSHSLSNMHWLCSNLEEDWVSIKRQRSLLRRMGRFNISQGYDKLVARRHKERKKQVTGWQSGILL